MLQFPTNALPDHLEEFLRKLHGGPGEVLRMPVKLEHGGGLGAAVQAAQTIATWSQLAGNGRPIALSQSFAQQLATRDRLASTLPGMAALYFATSITSGHAQLSRFEALEAVAPRVRAMQACDFRNTLRGIGIALVCFAGARSEFLNPLYSSPQPGAVRGHSDFRLLLQRMLSDLSSGLPARLTNDQVELLSALVYQLFLNTDEHGSNEVSGRRYATGMRGITARLTTLEDIPSVVQYAGDDGPLRAYLSKVPLLKQHRSIAMGASATSAVKKAVASPIRLVELSVFDTGPGLALNWLAQSDGVTRYSDFDEERELEAIQRCFEKHASTKATQFSGLGLTTALRAMKMLNAFMTLRTGRMSLYQDFSTERVTSFEPRRRYPKKQRLPVIAGSGYTVLFRLP